MAEKFISFRNLKFLLYEVFDVQSLAGRPYYRQHNRNTFDMTLNAAMKLSYRLLKPIFAEMDHNPPTLVAGQVRVHPAVSNLLKEFGQGGWIAATFPEICDGEQLPFMIANACFMIFSAANYSASVYPGLTAGAARLIASFGNDEQKRIFLTRMLSGHWQGTMALTEPQAGSSLSDIMTTAFPEQDGYYRMRGRKTFISAGDHDGVENIVHLMLARIEGAPVGPKGISLFIVPKKRLNESGNLISNDIAVSQIFHKMGYRGAPIVELCIGDDNNCMGYLLGQPHKGLAYMFQMMNEERIGVGLGAASIASAAYHASMAYCRERCQGRPLTSRNPLSSQVPIIYHADVKRMLLFQRSVVEGSLSLLMQCSLYQDLTQAGASIDEPETYRLLLELLTPVAKTYASEMGILSVSAAIQCFGGYGYCQDFPVEQHFRDMRIHPIHEGTTGIQGMDLLGRKVVMENGKAFVLYLQTVQTAIDSARRLNPLIPMADKLGLAKDLLQDVTLKLTGIAVKDGPEIFLADAVLYLEFFGIVTIAWQWLLQAISAQQALDDGPAASADFNFYQGKLHTARYFFSYELVKISGLAERLTETDPLTVNMKPDYFTD
jgi:butyryl-CoA dehydrogenase